jgi:hypothetical protein
MSWDRSTTGMIYSTATWYVYTDTLVKLLILLYMYNRTNSFHGLIDRLQPHELQP